MQTDVGRDRNLLVCREMSDGVEPQPACPPLVLSLLEENPSRMSRLQASISAVVMYLEASVQSAISDLS